MKNLNFEDERIMCPEENNCFAWEDRCEILTATKLSDKDLLNCGTLNCDFYKPKEHANSVKHITADGIFFETREEFAKRTGIAYLPIDDCKAYECFPHASPEEVDRAYVEYMKKLNAGRSVEELCKKLPYMNKTDLIATASTYGLKIDTKSKKTDIVGMLTEYLNPGTV